MLKASSSEPGQVGAADAVGLLPQELSRALQSPAFQEASAVLNDLEQLPEDWDSYGAAKPSPANIAFARSFLHDAGLMLADLGLETPVPFVAPTAEGGIQFDFAELGRVLELEIKAPCQFEYLKLDPDGEEEGKFGGLWPANRLLLWLTSGAE